jgi:GcrA cell cycle regulator
MEPTNWASEHSDALREHLAWGLSFSEAARRINAKFKTAYTRNAAIGRAKRMGLAGPGRPETPPRVIPPRPERPYDLCSRETKSSSIAFRWPTPELWKIEPANLRCVAIEPRHLSLLELEHGDCRYPYGGDEEGETITFCGHPRHPGSSYCAPHFHLSRNPVEPSEEAVSTVSPRAVEAA